MSMNNGGPWWDAPSKSGLSKNITVRSAIVLALVVGVIAGALGASSSGSLFGHSVNLVRSTSTIERPVGSVAEIAQRVLPSVVSIEAKSSDGGATGSGFVIDNFFGGSKVHDPAQRDPKTIALREAGKLFKSDTQSWVSSLIPTGDGLLLATKL